MSFSRFVGQTLLLVLAMILAPTAFFLLIFWWPISRFLCHVSAKNHLRFK